MTSIDELYQQVILDHNRSPRNYRQIESPTHHAQGVNPLCGDEFSIYLTVDEDGIIQDIAFQGQGCAISKASASMMTEALKGQAVERARELFKGVHAMLVCEDKEQEDDVSLGKLRVFKGVWRYPARVKCAALSWHAMNSALDGEEKCSTEDKM